MIDLKRIFATLASALIALSLPAGLSAATGSALEAIDSDGVKVTLPVAARRIISLSPAATEALFAIGAGKSVVGDTTYCDYPAEALALPKVGEFSASSISIEQIVALKPDLVVSAGKVMHHPVTDALARFGIPVFAYAPGSISAIARDMASLGTLAGTRAQAESVGAAMLASIDRVRAALSVLKPSDKLTVFWEMYDDPLMTCGAATFPHALIEAAGGIDLFGDLAGEWPTVSAEEVIRRAPAVIAGADDHMDKLTAEKVAARPGWGTIPAVKSRRIYLFPAAIVSRATPRLADGVAAMAKALYPRLFK